MEQKLNALQVAIEAVVMAAVGKVIFKDGMWMAVVEKGGHPFIIRWTEDGRANSVEFSDMRLDEIRVFFEAINEKYDKK